MTRKRKPRAPKPEFEILKLSKGNGAFRTIYKPRRDIKATLRTYIPVLEEIALKLCPPNVVHGFWPARNCVSNATRHVGPWRYTVCMDLKDFFDHCTRLMLVSAARSSPYQTANTALPDSMTPDNACRQGLPTSPAAANVCFAQCDWNIQRVLKDLGVNAVYTRYADDLTFSVMTRDEVDTILKAIPGVVRDHGFVLNERKTHVQYAGAGRRIITGVAVDETGVYPTRKSRRRLRAAKHKTTLPAKYGVGLHRKHRAAGLAEWCRCKMPLYGRKARQEIKDKPDEALLIAAKARQYAVKE
jgi:hypothetical protein